MHYSVQASQRAILDYADEVRGTYRTRPSRTRTGYVLYAHPRRAPVVLRIHRGSGSYGIRIPPCSYCASQTMTRRVSDYGAPTPRSTINEEQDAGVNAQAKHPQPGRLSGMFGAHQGGPQTWPQNICARQAGTRTRPRRSTHPDAASEHELLPWRRRRTSPNFDCSRDGSAWRAASGLCVG